MRMPSRIPQDISKMAMTAGKEDVLTFTLYPFDIQVAFVLPQIVGEPVRLCIIWYLGGSLNTK